ncbi:sporulation protein YtxC [Pontibacillus yanchengensis]|uniref:Sporulation protein n=1 Tax=Pontibacillus yanchengensis Y32 TaxID=1385514 RepID=A0A0A2TR23_9BACI|nr:sporulation protein YtxC [Pontibacillus yanchengensis]KGP71730.1 hypothetical protein N782_16895 [Pontibacillus yanchengensis Y32]
MKEICFEYKQEALSFCESILDEHGDITIQWRHQNKTGYTVNIESGKTSAISVNKWLVNGLIHVFTLHREQSWIQDIIRNCYYYNDEDEVAHIFELCQSFLQDDTEQRMVPLHELSHGQHTKLLYRVFENALNEGDALHFDSVVTFRLQYYKEELIDFVGYAIDEYKREEEYQTYVQQLREYVGTKKAKIDHLVIVQKDASFLFFNSSGKPISNAIVKNLAQQEPLYLFGLGKEELNLTPIMALAPEQISFYGDDVTDPKTLTVMNVFQERMEMYPLSKFPFKRLSSL